MKQNTQGRTKYREHTHKVHPESKMLKINPNFYIHAYFMTSALCSVACVWAMWSIYSLECFLCFGLFSFRTHFLFVFGKWNRHERCAFVKNQKKKELNAKRKQILPFIYSIFNLTSHFIFMTSNEMACCFSFFLGPFAEIS